MTVRLQKLFFHRTNRRRLSDGFCNGYSHYHSYEPDTGRGSLDIPTAGYSSCRHSQGNARLYQKFFCHRFQSAGIITLPPYKSLSGRFHRLAQSQDKIRRLLVRYHSQFLPHPLASLTFAAVYTELPGRYRRLFYSYDTALKAKLHQSDGSRRRKDSLICESVEGSRLQIAPPWKPVRVSLRAPANRRYPAGIRKRRYRQPMPRRPSLRPLRHLQNPGSFPPVAVYDIDRPAGGQAQLNLFHIPDHIINFPEKDLIRASAHRMVQYAVQPLLLLPLLPGDDQAQECGLLCSPRRTWDSSSGFLRR